jgi:nucleotide-binding universal stress UspA family protein
VTLVVSSLVAEDRFAVTAIANAKDGLDEARQLFESANLPCTTHLSIRGLGAGDDLVKLAREQEVDLIVIGVKQRSNLSKLIMGSVAQYVVLNAHCPAYGEISPGGEQEQRRPM